MECLSFELCLDFFEEVMLFSGVEDCDLLIELLMDYSILLLWTCGAGPSYENDLILSGCRLSLSIL